MANELKTEGSLSISGSEPISLPKAASDPLGPFNGDMYYNTVTNQIKTYNNGTWKVLSGTIVDLFTLTNTDITNKYVTLSSAPQDASKVRLDIVGGPTQVYGTDFSISGNQLSWSTLFLDGVLAAGDMFIVQYE